MDSAVPGPSSKNVPAPELGASASKPNQRVPSHTTSVKDQYWYAYDSLFSRPQCIKPAVQSFLEMPTHVFHDVHEVLTYSLERYPKNNNIHVVGVYQNCTLLESYNDYENKPSGGVLPLVFHSKRAPTDGDTVSLYGYIGLHDDTITFHVTFWRTEQPFSHKYLQALKALRHFAPTSYLDTMDSRKLET